jgi:hypothetical protein
MVSAAAWNTAADTIESTAKAIHDLRAQLAVLMAAQQGHRRDWSAAQKRVISESEVVTQGSADQVRELGFDVLTRIGPGLLAAPVVISAVSGKAVGEAVLTWHRGLAKHGFIVQRATDLANQATYSSPEPRTKAKYTLVGGNSGAVVHFRVAAIDPASPSGQSPWSDWAVATVR